MLSPSKRTQGLDDLSLNGLPGAAAKIEEVGPVDEVLLIRPAAGPK